jgi:hypothetical protein
MKRIITFSIVTVSFLLVLPTLVNAQELPGPLKTFFVEWFGFPEEWTTFPNAIYYGIIPFLGIWLIIYGFLTMLKIFGRGRETFYAILSLFIALSTLPLRVFVFIVSTLFGIMGIWSVGVFAAMFFVGVGILGWRFIRRTVGELKSLEDDIKQLDKRIKELHDKMIKSTSDAEVTTLGRQIETLRRDREQKYAQLLRLQAGEAEKYTG